MHLDNPLTPHGNLPAADKYSQAEYLVPTTGSCQFNDATLSCYAQAHQQASRHICNWAQPDMAACQWQQQDASTSRSRALSSGL